MIPKVVKMDVYPVAGHDSMELNLSGAHAPYFTRNVVVLEDSTGNLGVGEVPGGQKITKALEDVKDLVLGTSVADYKGTLKGGRSVIFEAKFTTSDRITADRVTDTQADYLAKAAALGAHCYILAGFSTGNVYKIPWEIWSEMKSYFGRKYVQEADLKQYQVNAGWHGMLMII